MNPSIVVSYEEFRQMISTFCKECDSFNSDELENSFKCVSLAFLGLQRELLNDRQVYELPILFKIAIKKFMVKERDLLNS